MLLPVDPENVLAGTYVSHYAVSCNDLDTHLTSHWRQYSSPQISHEKSFSVEFAKGQGLSRKLSDGVVSESSDNVSVEWFGDNVKDIIPDDVVMVSSSEGKSS